MATPIGFYVGCITLPWLYTAPAQHKLTYGSPVLQLSSAIALMFVVFVLVRVVVAFRASKDGTDSQPPLARARQFLATRIWSPHAATTIIGIAFVVMLLLVGAWAYTDVLAELARGMSRNLVARILLLVALFGGAALGGWTAGRFRPTGITPARLLRCFLGGALVGWGSLLIPGGNDGLILVGLPLLWPYAWLAFLTMCVSIGVAQLFSKSLIVADQGNVGS